MCNQLRAPVLFILVIAIFLAGCSSPATQDDSYLKPIPESTISAFQENQSYPIDNKVEAVIAARQYIAEQSSYLVLSQDDLRVRSSEKTNLVDVYKTLNYNTDNLEDVSVWFVIFDASWQSISQAGEVSPLMTGCMYVYLDVKDPKHKGLSTRVNAPDCIHQ